jgi:dihydroorotase
MSQLLISNGRLIDPGNGIDDTLDLYISDGVISGVGKAPAGFKPDQTIDASGLVVCPGLVDLCAHLREPGEEHKATLASETAAAAASGITTVCCPPETDPVVDTPAVATLIYRRAERIGKARVLPIGALTKGLKGEELAEMAALKEARCAAMCNGRTPLTNTLVQRRALEYAATYDITVFMPPEDHALRDNGCAHEGPISSRLGLPGIPVAAETVAVAKDTALAAQTGCHIHFRGLSSAEAVKMVQRAREDRLPITADVSAHQLHLTEMDLTSFDSNCHVIPPLRGMTDREILRKGLAEGVIGAICSDHQPHEPDAKEAPFPSTAPGISAMETLLPLTLKLVEDGLLSLPEALARITCGPADILGQPLGRLGVGASADVCIFNPDEPWTLTPEEMVSKGHNTPFLGWQFTGRVTHTLLQGNLVFER